MYWRYWGTNLWLNTGWVLAHWRRRFALFWYGGDKTPWMFVAIAVFVVAALGFGLRSAIAYQDERRKRVREFHQQSLTCLARKGCTTPRSSTTHVASAPLPVWTTSVSTR